MLRSLFIMLWLLPCTPAVSQEKLWRVGLLSNGTRAGSSTQTTTWRSELLRVLALNGFNQGRNLVLVDRFSELNPERIPQLAREIGAAGVDVLVAVGDNSVRAALASTQAIPIIMVVGDDPVATGLVASLARPGGRVTGIVFQTIQGDAKRLQLLSEAIPGARRFARLAPALPNPRLADRLALAAAEIRIELTTHAVTASGEYAAAFAAMRNEGAAGALITSTQSLSSDGKQIAAQATEHGLPTMCEWAYMAREGCVFAYGHDLAYANRRVGEYVVRILKGALPADLPVEQSDAWKLVINLQSAKTLGLTVPATLLARADEVIE